MRNPKVLKKTKGSLTQLEEELITSMPTNSIEAVMWGSQTQTHSAKRETPGQNPTPPLPRGGGVPWEVISLNSLFTIMKTEQLQ